MGVNSDVLPESSMLFSELAPFLDLPIDQTSGMKIGDLAFASAEDKWSTCFLPIASSAIAAGSTAALFQTDIGQSGQGSQGANLTISETNLKGGLRQPANQVYVATHLGFSFYFTNTSATAIVPIPMNNVATIHALGLGLTWFLNVGDMIQRTLGTLGEYPAGSGAFGNVFANGSTSAGTSGWGTNGDPGEDKRALRVPIVFPPNINVEIGIQSGTAITLYDNLGALTGLSPAAVFPAFDVSVGGKVGVRATFSGFRMTVPVK
jgi:hypothetical protein